MIRWLFSVLGYLAYTLVVLVFLLWWRFPADEIARWCEARLHARYPALVWHIGSLKWQFPNRFVLDDIQGLSGREAMIDIDSLTLTADLSSLVRKTRRITYKMRLYGGTGTGRIHLVPGQPFSCQGRFAGLDVEQMHGLVSRLKRAVRGRLGTTFSWQGSWPELRTRELSGMVTMENGLLPLRKPVLGLKKISFSRLEAGVVYKKHAWLLDKGVLEAKTMHVSFHGKIMPATDLGHFKIDIAGSLTPRAELFRIAGSRDMARTLRGFLRNGALPFTVSGTAAEPAVQFPEDLSRAMRYLRPRGGGR